MTTATAPADVVAEFADAYNSGDDDRLLALCSEGITVTHHNRGILIEGKEAFAGLLGNFKGAFPDKQFVDRVGPYVDGATVVVRHTWKGTAVVDVPGWAAEGEAVSLDLCTLYTVRDGLVVEYHDYG